MTASRYTSGYSSAVAGGGAAFTAAYGGGGAAPTTSSIAAPQQSAFKAFTPSAGLVSSVGGVGGGFAARSTYDVVADALNGSKEDASGDSGMSYSSAAASGVGFMGRMSTGTTVPGGAAITPHRPPSGGGIGRF